MNDSSASQFRSLRAASTSLRRAPVGTLRLRLVKIGPLFFVLFCVVVGIALHYISNALGLSERFLGPTVIALFFAFWFLPIIAFFVGAIRVGKIPWATYQSAFSWKARLSFAFIGTYFVLVVLDILTNKTLSLIIKNLGGFTTGLTVQLSIALALFLLPKVLAKRQFTIKTASPSGDLPFGLYVGTSTGFLGTKSHGAAIAGGQNVTLSLPDSAQNICVLGGIGSGKTTRAIQPLLTQLLDQNAGGLIFDIKGDFKNAVLTLASNAKKNVIVLGPHHTSMNLLSGLTPEVASSFLRSAFILSAKGNYDTFWIDTATELSKNVLGILSFLPSHYSLSGLYAYLYDSTAREEMEGAVSALLSSNDLTDRDIRLIKSYQSYELAIFSKFDEKVRSGVHATIAQVLSPFNHPDLIDAFCTESEKFPQMEEVLSGSVFLIDLPLSIWGLGGKVAYNFIKLRFFNVMQRRSVESSWDQERPVFFMCDEFQEIVSANRDGLSDLNFWDKSRSSKCIGIISAQGVSSFYAAIGDHDIANTLLQNFRQKIVFRTEDRTTIELINHLLGRVEVERLSTSESSTSGQHHSTTSSESRSIVEKQVLNPQAFRRLGPNQAVVLLSISGYSMDDVIKIPPDLLSQRMSTFPENCA